MIITFATHNDHKTQEVQAILSDTIVQLRSLKDIDYHEEIIEDGQTLDENAWIKTNTILGHVGGHVISDDTGLEVDALGGAPGVYSARYAGPQKNSADNMDKLLSDMEGLADRGAQFRTVIAAVIHGEKHTFEGIVRGQIISERKGTGGFGYDPIFQPEGYDQTFGELDPAVKNEISHRGRAFSKLAQFLMGL